MRLLVVALFGCHVVTQADTTRPEAPQHIRHPEGAIARRPTIVLGDDGRLRFVEPLECPTEDVVAETTTTEIATRPNLATFVVGVVLAGVGGIVTAQGALDKSTPPLVGGLAGVAIGLPLAIGPWLGTHVELREGPPTSPLRRPGPSEPCGDRPLAARSATLTVHGIEVHGAIGADGGFAVSPYQLVDAYQTPSMAPLDITAIVDAGGGARTIAAMIAGGALASHAQTFLGHADFDASIEPLRMVPGLSGGAPQVTLAPDAVRIAVPIKNEGPGDAYAVRGHITASHPALDGRVIYIGKLARGAAIARELAIPITAQAADALKNTVVDVSIELHDAHGTAPATPLRFHGKL
jgi:hypothetical protein